MIDVTCFSWVKMIQKSELPAYAKYLAHYLSTYMNLNQDVAWPSLARIATETGMGRSTVKKHLNVLEGGGWLVRERGNSTTNTRYMVNVPTEAIQLIALGGRPPGGLQVGHDTAQGRPRDGVQVGHETAPNNNLITTNNKEITRAPRSKKPNPPDSLDTVRAYCVEKNLEVDPSTFWNWGVAGEWHDGNGKPILNWKQKLLTWNSHQPKRRQVTREGSTRTRDISILEQLNDTSWAN